jgi:hypothetical protein
MSDEELIDELKFNSKWLTEEYKQSNYYKEYLKLVFQQLIINTKKEKNDNTIQRKDLLPT